MPGLKVELPSLSRGMCTAGYFTFELDVHSILDFLSLSHASSSGGHSSKLSPCISFLHRGHLACGCKRKNKIWATLIIGTEKKMPQVLMYGKFCICPHTSIVLRSFITLMDLGQICAVKSRQCLKRCVCIHEEGASLWSWLPARAQNSKYYSTCHQET